MTFKTFRAEETMITATEKLVLSLLADSRSLAARTIADRLNLTFKVARATAQRLVRAGLVTRNVVREFEKPDNSAQSWRFGGATMCVRKRAYYALDVEGDR